MTKRSNSIAFWAGIAVFLVAVLAMTQTVRNEYPFFAGYVILQFVVMSVAWSILGGYAGYVNFGTNAFFGVGVYTAVALFKASGAPLVVQIAAAGVVGMLLGLAVGLLTLFGASWAPAISFAMLLGVLAVRPQGLFGRLS